MAEHYKIDCYKVEDRKTLTVILAMNGYTVRMGKEKRGGKSTLTYFVEYWRADNEG
ncbi:resolvase [Faecalibacterium prausnitzii]|uniref:resolvase n=1 Tax=Faecalibacterium prausnitzii TaxID=853 RepID=UPI001C032A7B|nr:resolvase [Faecalibacterium prausnitzii]MBT9713202.1 resolvase [Faecalibacterium prausnitzii]